MGMIFLTRQAPSWLMTYGSLSPKWWWKTSMDVCIRSIHCRIYGRLDEYSVFLIFLIKLIQDGYYGSWMILFSAYPHLTMKHNRRNILTLEIIIAMRLAFNAIDYRYLYFFKQTIKLENAHHSEMELNNSLGAELNGSHNSLASG